MVGVPEYNLNTFKPGFPPQYESPGKEGDEMSLGIDRRRWSWMPIVGYQRLSLKDYPGRLCAKAVIPGCNFRCPYCTRRDLIFDFLGMDWVTFNDILGHLYRVRGYITGFCIGGGEPTIHNGLLEFAFKVKSVGYRIKLDTNGTRPRRINKLMEEKVLDYVAMDIKAPLDRYGEVIQKKVDLEAVEESIRLLRRGSVDYEFGTTVVPGLVEARDLQEIAQTLVGSRRFVIRQFKVRHPSVQARRLPRPRIRFHPPIQHRGA
jgi:pyruvate formate lyase activating enzyme